MQKHQNRVFTAKDIFRRLIKGYYEAEYVEIVKIHQDDEFISECPRRYLLAIKYSIFGRLVWSLNRPRYNTDVTFNKRQRSWIPRLS